MLLPLVIIFFGLICLTTHGDAQDYDPILNMCVRFEHQSVVKNSTLYIDGGKETFTGVNAQGDQEDNITAGYNEYVIAIDLSRPWDWEKNISEKAIAKPTMPAISTSPPILSHGALFYGYDGDPNVFLWGGTTSYVNTSFPGYLPPLPTTFSMWSFNIFTHAWSHYDFTENIQYRPSSGSYAEARDQALSFFLNGIIDSGSSTQTMSLGRDQEIALKGMVVIDHKKQTARNISSEGFSGDKPRSRGRMQFVGVGEHGILVQIGGKQKDVRNTMDTGITDLLPMDKVDVYDVSALNDERSSNGEGWYKQVVTGDIPEPRVDFCLILVTAPDASSRNIYMYGGRGENNVVFDDIHILSIPSFTWVKVYQGDSPRYGHTCHRVGSRTMLSVGGVSVSGSNITTRPCDWQKKGVNALDVSTMTWSSKYNKTTDRYAIPAALVSAIGGSSEGNATKTTPAEGFSESGLASLFGSTFVAPSAANSSTTPQKPKSTGQKRAIIAGSLLGSLTLVVLIGAAFWYFRRGLQKFVLGDITETHEVDGTGKNAGELPGKAHFWELPGTEPAELWSPTITDSSGMSPEMFKHETSSDKDLGWRGPVSPLELEESAVSPLGSEKTAIDPMELEESAVSPLGSEKTAINPLEQEKGVQVEVKRIQDGDSDSVINMPCETQEQPKELG